MNIGDHVTTIIAEPLELPAPLSDKPAPEPQPVRASAGAAEPATAGGEGSSTDASSGRI